MVDQHNLALARARVLLKDIAPELPEDEIVSDAGLAEDLGLDIVSIWALAHGLEKMAKVEINDADISSATTLGNLLEHALSDVPIEFQQIDELESTYDDGGSALSDDAVAESTSTSELSDDDDSPENLQSALEDLADLFNT